MHGRGNMNGGGHVWQGRHVWQWGIHGGGMHGGDMHCTGRAWHKITVK